MQRIKRQSQPNPTQPRHPPNPPGHQRCGRAAVLLQAAVGSVHRRRHLRAAAAPVAAAAARGGGPGAAAEARARADAGYVLCVARASPSHLALCCRKRHSTPNQRRARQPLSQTCALSYLATLNNRTSLPPSPHLPHHQHPPPPPPPPHQAAASCSWATSSPAPAASSPSSPSLPRRSRSPPTGCRWTGCPSKRGWRC